MLIQNAKVVLPSAIVESCSVLIRDKRIAAVRTDIASGSDDETVDARGCYLTPGFIDLHMHLGLLGPEFPPDRELQECSRNLPKNGTTRYCASLISAVKGDLPQFFKAIRDFLARNQVGARPVGVHLEGPYIFKEAKGGFQHDYITTPAEFSLGSMLDEGSDLIKIVTLSPELPGAIEVIRDLVHRGIVASMGHTWAGLEEYQSAREAGATHCCHTYNNRRTFPDSPKGGKGICPGRPGCRG